MHDKLSVQDQVLVTVRPPDEIPICVYYTPGYVHHMERLIHSPMKDRILGFPINETYNWIVNNYLRIKVLIRVLEKIPELLYMDADTLIDKPFDIPPLGDQYDFGVVKYDIETTTKLWFSNAVMQLKQSALPMLRQIDTICDMHTPSAKAGLPVPELHDITKEVIRLSTSGDPPAMRIKYLPQGWAYNLAFMRAEVPDICARSLISETTDIKKQAMRQVTTWHQQQRR